MEIVQHIFGLYDSHHKAEVELAASKALLSSNLWTAPPGTPDASPDSPLLSRSSPAPQTTAADGSHVSYQETAFTNPAGVRFDADEDVPAKSSALAATRIRPFGLPVLIKLFRFFCSIVNPNYSNNTDTMRFLGLALVNCVLEIASSTIERTPKLLELVRDDLSKFLMQSLSATDNVSIMTVSLRVAFNLFISLRHRLKFQLELFFNCSFRYLPCS